MRGYPLRPATSNLQWLQRSMMALGQDNPPHSVISNEPRVAVVTVNYRTPELTMRCLVSLEQERDLFSSLTVVVVDGGSGDGSAEQLAHELSDARFAEWVTLLPLTINGGFGWANNQAIRKLLCGETPPDYIYLLNPDTVVLQGAVKALADGLQTAPEVAAIGSQLFRPDGSAAPSAFRFPTLRGELARGARTGLVDRLLKIEPTSHEADAKTRDVDWVTGASVMFRSDALREVGLFDDGFFLYHEELELMWRMRAAGWAIKCEPSSEVVHIGGASTGVDQPRSGIKGELQPRRPAYWYESRCRYFARTRGLFAAVAGSGLWFVGHLIWRARWRLGLAPGEYPVACELRDHLRFGIPRPRDRRPVNLAIDCERTSVGPPAWMS